MMWNESEVKEYFRDRYGYIMDLWWKVGLKQIISMLSKKKLMKTMPLTWGGWVVKRYEI